MVGSETGADTMSKIVRVAVAIPTMGYTDPAAYCNRLVNFMIIEDILFLKGGEGKSYKPFVYAPRPDVWKNLRVGGMDWTPQPPKPDSDGL